MEWSAHPPLEGGEGVLYLGRGRGHQDQGQDGKFSQAG